MSRITISQALDQFKAALGNMPAIAERVDAGQQFNCYDTDGNDEHVPTQHWLYLLCVGPIGDYKQIYDVYGQREAALFEAAFKVATEAYRHGALIAQAPAMVEALRGLVKIELEAGATHMFCDHCEAPSDDNDNCDHEPDCTLGNAIAILAQIDGGAA